MSKNLSAETIQSMLSGDVADIVHAKGKGGMPTPAPKSQLGVAHIFPDLYAEYLVQAARDARALPMASLSRTEVIEDAVRRIRSACPERFRPEAL